LRNFHPPSEVAIVWPALLFRRWAAELALGAIVLLLSRLALLWL